MAVQLRQCSEEDIPVLVQVSVESYKEHYLHLWTEERYWQWYINRSFSAESFREGLNDKNALFYLVLEEGRPVGFVKLNKNKAWQGSNNKESLELERIYLLEEASGKGIGRQAVQQVVQLAKEMGKKIIWLKSMDSSPAVYFYKKMGFRICGAERLTFKGLRDEYRGMYVMELVLG